MDSGFEIGGKETYGDQFFGILVWNGDAERFFTAHDDFNEIQGRIQIFEKARLRRQAADADTETLCDDERHFVNHKIQSRRYRPSANSFSDRSINGHNFS